MLIILSPAKTVNFDTRYINRVHTEPLFRGEASELINILKAYDPWELARFMKVSDQIAAATFRKHMSWEREHTLNNSKQAMLAYSGIVFQGLNAESFDKEDIEFAEQSLRILSGLYGVLRPMDLIQPYRLEMAMKLNNSNGKDLYIFWKDRLTEYFKDEIKKHCDNTLINLASKEYSSAIDVNSFSGRVITPVFKEYNKGKYKIVTVNAKRARGMMSKYIIKNKLRNIEDIKNFDEEGYYFEEEMSSTNEWVFLR
jgi:cytoplasmic iron level regulating protein YaaA (DUF328/UPF0246 family)